MVKIQVVYQGQLHCEAVHGPSKCRISTDAPVDNHGRGESFSPTDLVATALGTCVITIMAIFSEKHSVDLAGTNVFVEKHMTSDGPRRIARLPVTVDVSKALDEELRKKIEAAAWNCPVHKSLHPDIDAPIEFNYPSAK